jgi:hypothetical protein
MARTEFEYNPSLNDYRAIVLRRLWEFWPARLYYILLILLLLVVEAISRVFDTEGYDDLINTIAGYWILAVLIPFVLALVGAGVSFRRDQRRGRVAISMDENGYRVKGPHFELYYEWQAFKEVRETKHHILMRLRDGRRGILLKRLLSPQVLSSVREIIQKKPVSRE